MSLLFPPHRGVGPGCNTREIAHKLIELKADIEDLEQREQELEQQKMWVQQSIKNVTEDVQNNRYPLASCLFLWAGRQCCWRTCTERVRRQSPPFGGGGALPSLGAASSAGHAALWSSGCLVPPWLSPGSLKFSGTVMFAGRELLLSEPQVLLFLSAELLLQLV